MRIAFLTTDNRDANRKYDVTRPWFGQAPTNLLDGFSAMGAGVEIHVVSCTQQRMESPEKLAENIFFHSVHVPKWGWLKSGYLGCIRAVRRKLREIGPDIVHGQGTERDCALSAVFSGYPNLLTLHGNMRAINRKLAAPLLSRVGVFHRLTSVLEALALSRTLGLICLSSYARAEAGSLCPRTWILPNAYPLTHDRIEPLAVQPPELLVPANLIPYKNQLGLMESLDALAAERSFTLVLAGKGADSAYGREVLAAAARRPWVRYAGMLDDAGMREALGRATAMVLPTLEDNCPMAVIEALAAGVPALASRIGGVPDLIRHGETGLLFDPLNPADMGGAVRRILEDPSLAARLALAGRDYARKSLHPLRIAQEHVDVYRQILGEVAAGAI
jgi:glycosyltransferase involved in cell wall biosynthesis